MSVTMEQSRSHDLHSFHRTVGDSGDVLPSKHISASAEGPVNSSESKNNKKVNFSEKDQIKKVSVGSISQKQTNSKIGTKRTSSFNLYSGNAASEENSTATSSGQSSPIEHSDSSTNNRDSKKSSSLPKSPNRKSVFHASSLRSSDSSLLVKRTETKNGDIQLTKSINENFKYHANSNNLESKGEIISEERVSKSSPNVSRNKDQNDDDKQNGVISSLTNQKSVNVSHPRHSDDVRFPNDSWRKASTSDESRNNNYQKYEKSGQPKNSMAASVKDVVKPGKERSSDTTLPLLNTDYKESPDSGILVKSPSNNDDIPENKSSPGGDSGFHYHANGTPEEEVVNEVTEEKVGSEVPVKREITIVLPDANRESPKEVNECQLERSKTFDVPKSILKKGRESTFDTKPSQKDAHGGKKRLTEESSSKPKKKPEIFSLPPAKQNGSLVTSGEEKRDKNNNDTAKKSTDKRQNSNPTKKSEAAETPRQSRSAPTKDRKSQSEITPKVNNYTKSREDTDISGTSKRTSDKDPRNNKKFSTSESKKRADNPTNFSSSKDEKSSNPSRASNHTTNSNKHSTSTEKYSVAHSQQSRNTNKESEKSVRSDKKQSESSDSKNESKKILDLEKVAKSRRSKTPNTARSTTPRTPRTPRSKTPSYFLKPHKVRYGVRAKKSKSEASKNDGGLGRTPEPKKSILNNKDAVKHEPASYSRPKSFKWERDKSIYRSQTRDWENETHEITHRPAVNSPTDWLRAYVGEIDLRDALLPKSRKSSREDLRDEKSKHKPGYPYRYAKEYILSRQQVQPYREMKTVYGDKLAKEKQHRQNLFFSRLQEFQIMKAKLKIEELQEREKKKEETKKRQQRQLKSLRQRFEDAAWVRFNSQYVTSRVLEHEKMNRYEYGLPEDINGEAEFAAKLKRKPVKTKIDLGKLDKKNKEVYSSLFNIYKGPNLERNAKTPPMEGIDTVTFEYEDLHGNKVERTRLVKDVINDARKEMDHLKTNNAKTGLTPREAEGDKVKVTDNKTYATNLSDDESDDDDDDDMSDIFERARKKYNLEVDDDEDSKSRR